MTSSYRDDSLGTFLDLVATKQPAPGGGAVAAITVSLAAGLVAMTARYSTSRLEDGQGLVVVAERLRVRAAALADADADAYAPVVAAYAAARQRDTSVGQEEIRAAMVRATEVPLAIAEVGAETARLARRLAVDGKPDLRGDAITALLLAESATRSASHLVAINVGAGGGEEELKRRVADHVSTARAAARLVE